MKNKCLDLFRDESESVLRLFPVRSRNLFRNNNFRVNKPNRDRVDVSFLKIIPAFAPNSCGMNFGI